MNRKQKGDKAERFVAEYLANLAFVVEIHPRTFRPVRIKGGRTVMVSKDNDYHNAFSILDGRKFIDLSDIKEEAGF